MIDFTTQQMVALCLMLVCLIGIAITLWTNDFKDE
jgi:hypothetical protein